MQWIWVILGSLLMGGLLFTILYYSPRFSSIQCQFCRGEADYYKNLSKAERRQIMTYFAKYEHRVPFPDTLFACRQCHRVVDDSFQRYHRGFGSFTCKVCGVSDAFRDNRTCACGEKYRWIKDDDCGDYVFLCPESYLPDDANDVDTR